jgi:hypothetical protein
MTIETCKGQVSGMEAVSKIQVTKEQRDLYLVLREILPGSKMPTNVPAELFDLVSKKALSDQQLLSEIICFTGGECHEAFKSAYPHIFGGTIKKN